MKVIKDVAYTQLAHPQQKLDVYLPDTDTFPVFIYFHGGGIAAGDKIGSTEEGLGNVLSRNGIAVIQANYRMYPEAHYPEFIHDAAAVVGWANKNMGEYGTVTGLFVGGSSAGGYLTQMLCFDKKYLAMYGIDADSIAGYVHDAGQPTAHFNVLKERGIDSRRIIIDESAPIYHITAGRDYAPMCILNAEFDMENRVEQTKLMMSTLKHLGADMDKVEYHFMPGYTHCKYLPARHEDETNPFTKIVMDFIAKYNPAK